MKSNKSLSLLILVFIMLVLPSTKALAAVNYTYVQKQSMESHIDDISLSRKESVVEFIKKNPECKDEVMKILKDKGALNADGSIKDDLGISNTLNSEVGPNSVPILYTGYYYTLAGTLDADFYPKEILAKYTNNTNSPKNFSVSQTYTTTTSLSYEVSIGSKAKLEEVYEISAGVKFAYTYTESASTQYGTQVSVPAYTTGVLEASAIKKCYSFREQYYLLGVEVGNYNLVGVFKPTGVHWYYKEIKN